MSTTIAVSPETRNKLVQLKLEEGYKNLDALLEKMIVDYKKQKLLGASELFREKLTGRGLKVRDLVE